MQFTTRHRKIVLGLAAIACLAVPGVAEAQTARTWNTTTGLWQTGANWVGGAVPSGSDTALFSGTSGSQTAQLNTNASIAGLTFSGAGTKTITSDSTTARVLTIGGSGITINSGAGAVTLGDATNPLNLEISASQTWTNNSSSLLTVLGTVRPNVNTTGTFTLTVAGSGSTTLSGALNNNSSRILALTKSGAGMLTLNAATASTYTGTTSVTGGTLALDFANLATPTNLLSSSSPLALSGNGSLRVTGKSSGATSQSFAGTTLSGIGGSLLVDPNGGDSTTVNLGALSGTSTAGLSFLVGTASGGDNSKVAITTTSGTDAQGIYGGRVVYADGSAAGYDWATTSSGASPFTLSGLASYSALATSAGTDTLNSRITANTTLGGNVTTNSLKVAAPAAGQSLAIGTGNTLALTSGGLLATGANPFTISRGTLTAGNGSGAYDLVIHQYNTGGLTISSAIANNGANVTSLTMSGTGRLVLSGPVTYTGNTFLNAGTLALNVFSGSTTTLSGTLSGQGTLEKTGAGVLVMPTLSNFTGPITLEMGTINWAAANNLGTGRINVTGNASLDYTPATAGPWMTNSVVIANGASLTFRTNTSGGAADGAKLQASGGSALNPVRVYVNGYANSPKLFLQNLSSVRGNVTIGGTPNFWYTAAETVSLHASNFLFDLSSANGGSNNYNADYVLTPSGQPYFAGGTFNRRLFVPGTAGVLQNNLTVNSSALATTDFAQASTATATFNMLPVYFRAVPNGANPLGVVFGGGLQGTAGTRLETGQTSPMGLSVSSAAGDVYLSQPWSQTAGTGSTYTVTGPGRVTLQNDSNITSGRLGLSSVPFTVRANLATTGTATIGAGSTLRLAGAAGRLSAGSHSAAIVNSGSLVYASASNQTLSGVISGTGSLGLAGDGVVTTGSLTLSGANTFSGATRLTAGSLLLNYSTQDNSKLSDTAALSLGNAAIALAGGSHAETVLSTSLTAGAATISRSSGNATLNLNAITRATGATLDLGAASIATTDSTNTSGILGGWATVAGADWAVNSTNAADGAITALASYTADTWSAGNNTNVTGGGSVDSATTNSLRFATASALTLSGVNTVSSGGILVASGGGGGSLTGGSLRTTSGGDLVVHQYDTGADFTIGSQLVDNGSPTMLVKTGPGTLVLSSSNAHTGGTQLNSGTLAFAAGGLGSSGTVGFAGNAALRWQTGNTDDISGRLALSNGATATLDTNGNNVSLGSGFGGTGGLVKAGAGTLTLSGSNTFSGLTRISAGTLALENSFGLGGSTLNTSGTGQLSFGSLTAATLGGLTGTSNLALTNASGQAVALSVGADNTPTNTYSGVLEGLGSFTKTGYGRLALTGPNRYVGSTTISNGYVQLSGGANRLPVGTNLSFADQAGAILDLNGQVQTIGSLTGGGASGGHVWVNNGTLFVGNATSGTYAGSFIDGGSIVKQGTGTLAVSGASTFGGTLRVDEGSVRMEGENRLGLFFNVVTGSAGTLDLNGFSAMVGSLIGSGTVSMKDGTGALTVRSQSNARNEFSGRLTGFGALIKEAASSSVAGRLTLTNSANDYSGGTQLAGGVLEFASGALGTTGQITVTTDPAIGGTTRLRWLSGNTDDISSRLVVIPGTTAVLDTNDNNVSFASGLGDGRNASFAKLGTGTLTLSGSNSYTGAMSLNAGTLLVDAASASAPATNPLSDASRLAFNSGSMLLRGKASGATNQSLQMVTVNGGGGSLLVDPNGGSGVTLNLGTINAINAGGAFVLGNRPGTTGGVSITTTSGTDAQGIYGGRVVYADGSTTGYDWATAASTAGDVRTLGAFSGYAALATTAGTDTSNSRITASTTLGGSRTTNSLKVAPASAGQSLSIGASQTLTLTSGGLLATGADAFTISAGTLAGGNGSGAYDLVIHQYNTGGLTISSVIGNNGGNATNLTKAGPGSLTLSGANTHTGGTRLTSGTLVINNATALGTSAGTFTIDPGTTIDNTSGAAASSLTLSSNNPQTWNGNFTYLGTGGRSLNTGTGAVTLANDVNLAVNGGTLTVGGISGGIYGLTKSGAGTLNLNNVTQSFGGPLTVAQGSVITNGNFPNTDIVMANVAGAGITMINTRSTIQSLSGGGSSGGNISMADGITIAGNASTTYGGVLSGGGTFIKNGLGTLTLTNASNSFPGDVRVNNGTLAFSAAGALGTAASAIELNQAGASSSGRLAYSANANATLSRPITVSNGLGTVSNLGSGTLTLSGTLTKNGTILRLNQGIFNVSGRITGASANSDLYVDNATVTLSNTNNDYNGPTLVYGGGTLALGASGVIPNGSAVTLGAAAGGSGALTVGGFSDTIASLTTGNDGSTVGISVNAGSTGSLTMGNLTFGGGTDTLALSLTSPSLGRYTLLTYTGVRSGTFDTVTGLTDSRYTLVYGGASNSTIDLQMKANQASTFTLTPASARVLVGGSTQLSGVLANSSPVNAAALTWSPLSTGSLSASGFNSSLGSTIASGSTSSITAWLAAGNTAGTQTWAITNTDNNAITTVSTATGSIAVVNQRNYSPSPSPISLGRFLITGAAAGSTTISSTGSFATTESGTLGTSATSNGLTLSFNNSGSRVFDGSASPQSAGYSVSGNWSGSAGAVSGTFGLAATNELSGGSTVDFAYTGNAVNQRTFSVSNSGTISLGNFLRTASMTGSTTISSSGLNATTANATLGSFGGTNTNGFTLSTNDSTAFNGAESQTANYSLGGSASSAGVINGSFSSTVSAELGSIDPVTVSLVGTAYDAASISKVQTGNVGNGDTISITNAAGSYRSAAYVASTTLTGPGWSVTGFGTGSSAAAGATLAGTAHFDGTGLLSGTYTGLFSATFQNDQTLAGAGANDLGSLSWNLYQTYVNTSGSGSTNLAANTALSTVSLVSGTGANATLASFAAGTTGLSAADVSMSFTSGTTGLYSNILNLEGTNGLAQVLQLTYDPSLLGSTSEDSLVLAWFDTTSSTWVNSVLGNIGFGTDNFGPGYTGNVFDGSWSQYLASTSGTATAANSLGAFGVDKANKTVWAAINHNSQFAVTVIVPEPGALALAGIGIAAAAYAYRRRK